MLYFITGQPKPFAPYQMEFQSMFSDCSRHHPSDNGHQLHRDTADGVRGLDCLQLPWEPQIVLITVFSRWILNGRWTFTVSVCRWRMVMCETKWICSRVTSTMCILDLSVSISCGTCGLVCRTHSECVVALKGTQNGAHGHCHKSPQQIMIHFVSFFVSRFTDQLTPWTPDFV
jgi:hypothetical protein